jgi:hypothetical protein
MTLWNKRLLILCHWPLVIEIPDSLLCLWSANIFFWVRANIVLVFLNQPFLIMTCYTIWFMRRSLIALPWLIRFINKCSLECITPMLRWWIHYVCCTCWFLHLSILTIIHFLIKVPLIKTLFVTFVTSHWLFDVLNPIRYSTIHIRILISTFVVLCFNLLLECVLKQV